MYSLRGHTDTITFLRLSPSGQYLLSCSNDSSVRIWDVRPFTSDPTRTYRVLYGALSNFEGVYTQPSWTSDCQRVAVGSADRTVTVWDVESGKTLYKVSQITFHLLELLILTLSLVTWPFRYSNSG